MLPVRPFDKLLDRTGKEPWLRGMTENSPAILDLKTIPPPQGVQKGDEAAQQAQETLDLLNESKQENNGKRLTNCIATH